MADRIIFHCDLNCFFASVELLEKPALQDVPVAVCGDPASRHGIILAKNEPAKQMGVQTAETVWQAKQKCPHLVLLPPHHSLYADYSRRVNAIYGQYTDLVEPFGIDESWLDVTGSLHLFGGDARQLADDIRGRLRQELGLTISVGVSFNKVFAKLGSDYKKPDATTVISRENWRDMVWPLPVGDLFGVGPSAAKRLNSCGIYTIGDLARLERDTAVKLFGSRGDTLWNYANGREADPVTKQRTRDNSYGNSVTMPRDLARPEDADATMLALCDSVGRRLRADGTTARVVTVQLVDNAFRRTSHQTTLPNPTNSTDRLYHVAIELMRQMWPQRPVRLVGVSAEKTGEDNFEQMDLFTDAARIDKQEKLDRAADALRRKFGGAAVTRATLLSPDTRKPEALSAAKEREKK